MWLGVIFIYLPMLGLWWVTVGYWQDRIRHKERCILDLLASGPMYGLDMVKQSGGLLSRGTVYVLLGRMQDRGLIEATEPDSDGRRRYKLASLSTSKAASS